MSTPFRVCLFGFAAADEQSLRHMMATDTTRTPHYVGAATLEQSDLVVANADNADALAELVRLELLDQAVYIGSDIEGEGWLKHPIDGTRLVRELDRLALRQAPWYAEKVLADEAAARRRDGPGFARQAADSGASAFAQQATLSEARPSAGRSSGDTGGKPAKPKAVPTVALTGTRALLVDDSDVALRFLETRLHRMGVQTERATHSGKALELLALQAFDYVLLDVELGAHSELDGLSLCQMLKREGRHAASKRAPNVILVSAHHSELDRARGALAGCDAYLPKPLDESLLHQVMVQHAPR
jgi:CheY-like chemotaxis protein